MRPERIIALMQREKYRKFAVVCGALVRVASLAVVLLAGLTAFPRPVQAVGGVHAQPESGPALSLRYPQAEPAALDNLEATASEAVPLVNRLRNGSTSIRGEKLPLNLLLRAIGRKGGVNIVVDEKVSGTISLDLQQISLYDLFQLVLETRGLRFYESSNALVVQSAEDFSKGQRDIRTERLCPRYGQSEAHLQELQVLKSAEGSMALSADGNCLVVRDHEENLRKIKGLINELDRPIPQVHIRARIVTIDKSASRELGIKWGYTDLRRQPNDSLSASADLGVTDAATSIVFGFIRDTFTLDMELSALQARDRLEVLSEPRVVVLDGEEAEIKQGKEVPYESGTLENRNTSFREAVLGLKVSPKILQNGSIRLDVKVTNDSVDENSTEDGQPILNRQEIRTNLFLEDGVTVVVGGILAKGLDETNGEVPWFADLPVVGDLFKSTDKKDYSSELLVFLTPVILNGQGDGGELPVPATGGTIGRGSSSSRLLLHPIKMLDTFWPGGAGS